MHWAVLLVAVAGLACAARAQIQIDPPPALASLTGAEDLVFIEVLVVEVDYDDGLAFGALHSYVQRTDANPDPSGGNPNDGLLRDGPSDPGDFAGGRPGERGDVRNAEARFPILAPDFGSGMEINTQVDLDRGVLFSTIQTLINEGKGRVLAKPSITAIDGCLASIKTVEVVPYLAKTTVSAGIISVVTEFKNVGLTLNVTPNVIYVKEGDASTRTDMIMMKVEPEDSTVTRYRMDGDFPIPIVDTRKQSTEVVVESGATFMISGILRKRNSAFKRGIPGLMDIPVVEAATSRKENINLTTELVITVTPTLVESRTVDLAESSEEIKALLEERVRNLDPWQEDMRDNISRRGSDRK